MRSEKKYLITEVEGHLKKSDYVYLANYDKMTVENVRDPAQEAVRRRRRVSRRQETARCASPPRVSRCPIWSHGSEARLP